MKIWKLFYSAPSIGSEEEARAVRMTRPWDAADFYDRAASRRPSMSMEYAEECLKINKFRKALKILTRSQAACSGYSVERQLRFNQDLFLAHRGISRYSLRPGHHRRMSEYFLSIQEDVLKRQQTPKPVDIWQTSATSP